MNHWALLAAFVRLFLLSETWFNVDPTSRKFRTSFLSPVRLPHFLEGKEDRVGWWHYSPSDRNHLFGVVQDEGETGRRKAPFPSLHCGERAGERELSFISTDCVQSKTASLKSVRIAHSISNDDGVIILSHQPSKMVEWWLPSYLLEARVIGH